MPEYVEIDIKKMYERKLYRSLCMASSSATYSICIEYMKKWFLSKFGEDFFKTIYIDNKHVLDEARNLTELQKLKKMKPSLAIIPSIDLSFDNEKLDASPYGVEMYTARGKFQDSFFKDQSNDVYLGLGLETNLVNFIFKVRLSTRAKQLDVYKYMKMAYRVGFTQGEDISVDFHVPYSIMLQMATDLGFTIKDNKISDVSKFLKYLNEHSTIPFIYKYRAINGHSEFFLRMTDMYVHISSADISADEGEREGHLSNNYVIELQAAVRFPAPKFYSYYSNKEHIEITSGNKFDGSDSMNSFTIKIVNIPEMDENKWPQYLTTEYKDDLFGGPLSIDFSELFEGDLLKTIEYSKNSGYSPSRFLNIKIFNGGQEVIEKVMNWDTYTLTTTSNMTDKVTFISIYCDLSYINEVLLILDNAEKARVD